MSTPKPPIPLSFATVSLGTPSDPLPTKLHHISNAGFHAIELGFPDLLSFASSYHGKDIAENDYLSLCSAGKEVKSLCEKFDLEIMLLQPFANFEGWEEGSKERDEAFERARGWIEVMKSVGCDMLQVGSTDSPNISTDPNILASDLRELADMLAPHGFKLAYENWCWATAAPTWSSAWEIVQLVNRENVGLCLDTFQTFGSEYADPTTASGLIETKNDGEKITQEKLANDFHLSMQSLTTTLPPSKIFLLQISDAYQPSAPLQNSTINNLRPKGRWSHDFRPYLWNGGAYTEQCIQVAKAVLETGSRCWFSVEVFDGGVDGKGGMGYDQEVFCKGAMGCVRRLLGECGEVEG